MANSRRVGTLTTVVTEQQALSCSDTLCTSVLGTGQGSSKSNLHLVPRGSPLRSRNIKAFRNLTLRTVPKLAMLEALKLYCKNLIWGRCSSQWAQQGLGTCTKAPSRSPNQRPVFRAGFMSQNGSRWCQGTGCGWAGAPWASGMGDIWVTDVWGCVHRDVLAAPRRCRVGFPKLPTAPSAGRQEALSCCLVGTYLAMLLSRGDLRSHSQCHNRDRRFGNAFLCLLACNFFQ